MDRISPNLTYHRSPNPVPELGMVEVGPGWSCYQCSASDVLNPCHRNVIVGREVHFCDVDGQRVGDGSPV